MVLEHLPVRSLEMGLDFRIDEDPVALGELAASILEVGVLEPILVRARADGRWEVVAGRRRLAAARQAGLAEVPCLVRDMDDERAADIALVENMHRRDLSPIEEGLAYARLREKGLTQSAIGARVGRSQKHVSTILSLLSLPTGLRDRVHRREIGYVTALDLAGRRNTKGHGSGVHVHAPAPDVAVAAGSADLITYWRRRHDRLLSAVQGLCRGVVNGMGQRDIRSGLDRLVRLDGSPLDDPS